MKQRSSFRGAVVDVNELLSVSQIGAEPRGGSAGDIEGGLQMGQKNGVTDGVKRCGEVKENDNAEVAGIC